MTDRTFKVMTWVASVAVPFVISLFVRPIRIWGMVIIAGALLAHPATARAQHGPSMFSTRAECETALAAGKFSYYAPVFKGDSVKNPIDGKNVFPVKLEADMCRHQHVFKFGFKWVVQAAGSTLRARKNNADDLVIFARNDCGNEDDTDKAAWVVAVQTRHTDTRQAIEVPVLSRPAPVALTREKPETTTVVVYAEREVPGVRFYQHTKTNMAVAALLLTATTAYLLGRERGGAALCSDRAADNFGSKGVCSFKPGGVTRPATDLLRFGLIF